MKMTPITEKNYHFFKSFEEGNFKSSPLRTTAYYIVFSVFSFTFTRYTSAAPCVSEQLSFYDFSNILIGILHDYHSFAMKGDIFYYNNLAVFKKITSAE